MIVGSLIGGAGSIVHLYIQPAAISFLILGIIWVVVRRPRQISSAVSPLRIMIYRAGWIFYLASFFLQAVSEKTYRGEGLSGAWCAFFGLIGFTVVAGGAVAGIFAMLASLSNFALVIAAGRRSKAWAVVTGLSMGCSIPALLLLKVHPMAGFFVWVGGAAMVLLAMSYRPER